MKLTKLIPLLLCSLMFSMTSFAQDDIKVKVMNATHLENQQVVIAMKSPGESQPVVVEVVKLGNYRDYANLSLPNSEKFYLFLSSNTTSFEKMSAVPETYTNSMHPLGMDGVKGCNIVVSGTSTEDIHFNMTNIQW